ncbi:sulfite exporter TauE/SafE family protein [Candidatus Babeliales bacterium]|nr:sulfite exporter TauE/SafE family protein [Candidatus Babeliales bacterium]
MYKSLLALLIMLSLPAHSIVISHKRTNIDTKHQQIDLQCDLDEDELLYKDALRITVDHPNATVIAWKVATSAQKHYIPQNRTTKLAYSSPVHLQIDLKTPEVIRDDVTVLIVYQTTKQKRPQEYRINMTDAEPISEQIQESAIECDVDPGEHHVEQLPIPQLRSWSESIQTLITHTNHLWVQLILILLLGLLMSLTPCIYPMIPITIGVMQGHSTSSFRKKLLLSIAYSLGVATTYSLLGLVAALTGELFGAVTKNPIIILLIIVWLGYLALSMFGLYDIYIPSFMRSSNKRVHAGSFLSVFTFGLMSGSIASPCLSPGLAFLLCIVATIGNAFVGFLMLFAFGIGLSIPLMLVGTFSQLFDRLPKAGAWMLEIKKIFGILLIGMCFFYLKNILPWYIVLAGIALMLVIIGIYYFATISTSDQKILRRFKNSMGTLLIVSSVIVGLHAVQAYYTPDFQDMFWITSYEQGLKKAQQENKLIFVDFWSETCSICTAINKGLLADPSVRSALSSFVPVKIDLNDAYNKHLQKKYAIKGLPYFLLIDTQETIHKQWDSSLYHAKKDEFIEELNRYF